jgi:large subunit ribosomal protein L4
VSENISVKVLDLQGNSNREIVLPQKIFGRKMNAALLKKVVVFYQQANQRSGTASTKNKTNVHGSGKKMRPQKRTGRARMGSKNIPHHRGGAVAFGPNNRSYERSTNKKERVAALFLALSEKVRNGTLVVVENLHFSQIKTKATLETLENIGLVKRSLFIDDNPTKEFLLSIRNLFYIDFLNGMWMNALSIMMAKKVFLTVDSLNKLVEKHA